MPTNAERFYNRMKSVKDLLTLIGTPEDADFDCKVWPERVDARRGSIAKAACGFANATGGVIVIGVQASGRGPETPDQVRQLCPVYNPQAVRSEALDIILKFVEPGIEGIRTKIISSGEPSGAGFILLLLPQGDGAPRRSKVDWKFYTRIASGTIPMEFFQIEDRFGRRPHSCLRVHFKAENMVQYSGFNREPHRKIVFGLVNEGRGVAKFPGIRFKQRPDLARDDSGIDGNHGHGLPPRASEYGWIVYRGGVDDIIYPGETRLIGRLAQRSFLAAQRPVDPAMIGQLRMKREEVTYTCPSIDLEYDVFAEGVPIQAGQHTLPEESFMMITNGI